MSIINTIRNKPREYKIKLIWTIVVCAVTILLIFWYLVNRIGENVKSAGIFFKQQTADIKEQGKQLYEENK